MEISCANTTLIGDYTSVVFSSADSKWLVQAQGNATFASTLALIKDSMIAVDRRYIFIQLEGNQVMTTERERLQSLILDLVVKITNKNPESRLFFVSVLPRFTDNQQVKPFIVKFNRWLAVAVHEMNIIFECIKFLPVHFKFLEGAEPRRYLYDIQGNLLLLSQMGAALFKQIIFQLAGFVKNQ